MAKSRGDDVIKFSDDDWKGTGGFKTAPSGKYRFKFNKKSTLKPGKNGTLVNVIMTIVKAANGKKTEHKGINVFDNVAPNVKWKIAQILKAMGIKKPPRDLTVKELLRLIKKYDGEIVAVIGTKMYNGKKQNPVISYIPLKASDDDDDDDNDSDNDDDDDDNDNEDSDDDDEDSDDDDDENDDDEDDEEDSDDDDEDDEDDEDDDEDDEDEDESPRKRKSSKSKSKGR